MKQQFKCQYCGKITTFKLQSKEFEKVIMSNGNEETVMSLTYRTFICESCGKELCF